MLKISLLFVGNKVWCGTTLPLTVEPAALLSIFDIQENHLKVWSYSQYPACNCFLLCHRENSQNQIQTFTILEQKAKDIGFTLRKERKSLHIILLNPLEKSVQG